MSKRSHRLFPEDDSRRLFSQAIGSARQLADQRDLYQIALLQWMSGRFTLATSSRAHEGWYEAYIWINEGDSQRDIVLEYLQQAGEQPLMMAQFSRDVINSAAKSDASDAAVRLASVLLEFRDRIVKAAKG